MNNNNTESFSENSKIKLTMKQEKIKLDNVESCCVVAVNKTYLERVPLFVKKNIMHNISRSASVIRSFPSKYIYTNKEKQKLIPHKTKPKS